MRYFGKKTVLVVYGKIPNEMCQFARMLIGFFKRVAQGEIILSVIQDRITTSGRIEVAAFFLCACVLCVLMARLVYFVLLCILCVVYFVSCVLFYCTLCVICTFRIVHFV